MTSVKKNLTTLGYVTINNQHAFSQGKNGFQISPRLQELMVYCGTLDTYENCNEVIRKFIDIEVSATQVHRVTTLYGEEIGKTINEEVILTPSKKDEVMYAMADGAMVLTREEGWKEVKVGRIFKGSDCIHAGEKPGWISNSSRQLRDSSFRRACRIYQSDGKTVRQLYDPEAANYFYFRRGKMD